MYDSRSPAKMHVSLLDFFTGLSELTVERSNKDLVKGAVDEEGLGITAANVEYKLGAALEG